MIIIATRRAFIRREILAAIGGAVGGGLHDENHFWIFRIYVHAADVEIAGDAGVFGDLAPVGAAIVGAEQAGFHDGEDSLAFGVGSDGETDASARRSGQPLFRSGLPGGAFVGGFVDPGILRVGIGRSGAEIERLPESGVENARIVGVGGHIGNAGHVVLVESFSPGLAGVGGSVHAAMFAGRVDAEDGMAEDADHDDVGIARVNEDRADEARIFQADVGPGGAGIGRAVDAVAGGLFAGADDDDVGIGGGDRDVADGRDVFVVKDWLPGGAIAGDADDCGDASGAVGADEAPAHGGIEAGINRQSCGS